MNRRRLYDATDADDRVEHRAYRRFATWLVLTLCVVVAFAACTGSNDVASDDTGRTNVEAEPLDGG